MKNSKNQILWLMILGLMSCFFLTACAKPAEQNTAESSAHSVGENAAEKPAGIPAAAYGRIESDFTGMTPEIAGTYLAVLDELSAHLGTTEQEASEGECLHGGFVRDWDGDGTPELCLLLKTSPRDPDGWGGTPIYGWYPPTLYLYTVRNGQAVRAGECDLYFATAGREAAVAALLTDGGVRYVRWDYYALEKVCYTGCYALTDGAVRKTEAPAGAAEAETAQAFLDALGADRAQLLLYNRSGEARIEGGANIRELRSALAALAG